MNITKFFRLLAFSFFVLVLGAYRATAQNTEDVNQYSKEQKDHDKVKNERKARFQKELNLTDKQVAELERLKSDFQVERGRHNDKVKLEKKAMRENHDKKLKSILDEKQYYAMKSKAKKMHRKHHGKYKNKRHGKNFENSPDSGYHTRKRSTQD